jgi:uncharacterized protein YoxC
VKKWMRLLLILFGLVQVVVGAILGFYIAVQGNPVIGLAVALLILVVTLVVYQVLSAFFQGVMRLQEISELLPRAADSVDRSTEMISAVLPEMQAEMRQIVQPFSDVVGAVAGMRRSVDRSSDTIDATLPALDDHLQKMVPLISEALSQVMVVRKSVEQSTDTVNLALSAVRADLQQMGPNISGSHSALVGLRDSFDSNMGGMRAKLGQIAFYFPPPWTLSTRTFAAVNSSLDLGAKSLVSDILDIVEGRSARSAVKSSESVVQGIVDATQRTSRP